MVCIDVKDDERAAVTRECLHEPHLTECRSDKSGGFLKCYCRTDYCNAGDGSPPPANNTNDAAQLRTVPLAVLSSNAITLLLTY